MGTYLIQWSGMGCEGWWSADVSDGLVSGIDDPIGGANTVPRADGWHWKGRLKFLSGQWPTIWQSDMKTNMPGSCLNGRWGFLLLLRVITNFARKTLLDIAVLLRLQYKSHCIRRHAEHFQKLFVSPDMPYHFIKDLVGIPYCNLDSPGLTYIGELIGSHNSPI